MKSHSALPLIVVLAACLLCAGETSAQDPVTVRPAPNPQEASSAWPVLRSYDPQHLARIALPLGGIGTGTVSLGGRGNLCDWEIMNRPAKGFVPMRGSFGPFFAIFDKTPDGKGCQGSGRARSTFPPMRTFIEHHAQPRPAAFPPSFFRYGISVGPSGSIRSEMPIDVRLEAFNPLSPAMRKPAAYRGYPAVHPDNRATAARHVRLWNKPILSGSTAPARPKTGKATDCHGRTRQPQPLSRSDSLCGIFMNSEGVADGPSNGEPSRCQQRPTGRSAIASPGSPRAGAGRRSISGTTSALMAGLKRGSPRARTPRWRRWPSRLRFPRERMRR